MLRGKCQCGETHVTLLDKPLFVHACHCLKCQKTSGSVFGITTIMLEADIQITQGVVDKEAIEEAPHRYVHSCASCGDHIYTTATNHPATALFRPGILDDPREISIDAHIFVKRKRPWLKLPEEVPQFEEFYDRAIWPQESLERLEKAKSEPH